MGFLLVLVLSNSVIKGLVGSGSGQWQSRLAAACGWQRGLKDTESHMCVGKGGCGDVVSTAGGQQQGWR